MKREREKHITRLHIILFFIVVIIGVIVYTIVNIKINNSDSKYKDLEDEIVIASEQYVQINDIIIEDGYEKRINIKKIYNQGLIQNELYSKCKGYVEITSEIKDFEDDEYELVHRAYISCGKKYTTEGYLEE